MRYAEQSVDMIFEPVDKQVGSAVTTPTGEGDVCVTRHSNLRAVHAVMHVACADPTLLSDESSAATARTPSMIGNFT